MESTIMGSMGGCQNYGPFLGTLNIRCRIVIGTQKGTIILTTTHMGCPQNYGPLGVIDYIYMTAPNISGYQNGTLILGIPHIPKH